MDFFKRGLAPITNAAWEEIEREAREAFRLNLSGRAIVDVGEPRGLEFSAANLGRLDLPEGSAEGPVRYGVRRVLPLVEARASFDLDIWEMDNLERGAADPDFADLQRAARDLARFEEGVIYEGMEAAGIQGLLEASRFDPVGLPVESSGLPGAVTRAVLQLRYAGVDGPYALALGTEHYRVLEAGAEHGYPIRGRITDQIGGPIVLAPFLNGGVLTSRRGGDAELILGQDIGIGYESNDGTTVRLYFTESFTFRVLADDAVVPMLPEIAH